MERSRDLIFNLDCIQKDKNYFIQQCCKVDFQNKKRVENLDFLPFFLTYLLCFLRFGLLHWLFLI
jgi:hypothetical protein